MEELAPPAEVAEAPKTTLSRRGQLLEMLVLLAVLLLPSVVSAFHRSELHRSFDFWAWSTLVRGLSLTALLLFLLWRNGESRRAVGWQFRWQDLTLGVLLFVPYWVVRKKLTFFLVHHGMTAFPGRDYMSAPVGPAAAVLCTATLMAAVVWEESFFRGYLLLRLRGLGVNTVVALLASALIFSSQHAYQGQVGLAVTGVSGLLYGSIYLWRKSIIAPVVLHLLWNLAAFYDLAVFHPLFTLYHALEVAVFHLLHLR